jgi:hypothetical protein
MSNSINPVLKTIMKLSGIKFMVNRDSEVVAEVDGLKNCDPYSGRNYIALFPGVDVVAGDLLVAVKSQEEFLIIDTEHEYVEGQWFQERAYYGSIEEYDASLQDESAQTPEQPDMFNDYLSYLDSLIAIKAPGSRYKFGALLLQVEEFLSTDKITKGSLAEYSQLLEENEWLAKAIGTILVSWVSR